MGGEPRDLAKSCPLDPDTAAEGVANQSGVLSPICDKVFSTCNTHLELLRRRATISTNVPANLHREIRRLSVLIRVTRGTLTPNTSERVCVVQPRSFNRAVNNLPGVGNDAASTGMKNCKRSAGGQWSSQALRVRKKLFLQPAASGQAIIFLQNKLSIFWRTSSMPNPRAHLRGMKNCKTSVGGRWSSRARTTFCKTKSRWCAGASWHERLASNYD